MQCKVPLNKISEELTEEEGLRLHPYKCTANHWTVGIGHNMDAEPLTDILGRHFDEHSVLEPHEVNIILDHDLQKVYRGIDKNLPWVDDLPDYQQYVMISLIFNMGMGGVLKFKNTLAAWKSGNIAGVISGLRGSKWYKQVGKRGPKLIGILKTGVL